jgi:KaiC/GvpD/RAD55 family RecA-like ATPase
MSTSQTPQNPATDVANVATLLSSDTSARDIDPEFRKAVIEAAVPAFDMPLRRYTVVTLCGPTCAGKSTFAQALAEALWDQGNTCVIVSSDAYRRQILARSSIGGSTDSDIQEAVQASLRSHSEPMSSASGKAFKMLMNQLDLALEYPYCPDVIVVDTTGFDPTFRTQVAQKATAAEYENCLVLFDYKDRQVYSNLVRDDDDVRKARVHTSVDTFRRKVLPNKLARMYGKVYSVRHPVAEVKTSLHDSVWTPSFGTLFPGNPVMVVPKGQAVAVVGDSHECLEELEQMHQALVARGVRTIILCGDVLNKGGNTVATIDWLHAKMFPEVQVSEEGDVTPGVMYYLAMGNHESYVGRALLGDIPPAPELEAEKFPAIAVLRDSPEAKSKLMDILAFSRQFYRVMQQGSKEMIVTHAPCEEKYLGKTHVGAYRNQRNLHVSDRTEDYRDSYPFIFEEAEYCKPFHVFGHVAHGSPKSMMYKNKVFLDTGCVYGGYLSAFVLKDGRYDFVQIKATKTRMATPLKTDLTTPKQEEKPFSVHDYDLSIMDKRLLRQAAENGVKYISGTMAPAPSTEDDLESLDEGFEFYRRRGVTRVVMQPKFMGSRGQIYLRRGGDVSDPKNQTMAVSRGGWRVNHVEGLEELMAGLTAEGGQLAHLDFEREAIVDGEITPWAALGKGLIDRDYTTYEALVGSELAALDKDEVFKGYAVGQVFDTKARLRHFDTFKKALARYSQQGPVKFEPFDILSIDGVVPQWAKADPYDAYLGVSTKSDAEVVDLSSEGSVREAHAYFKKLTVDQGMEGVVLKPLQATIGKTETGYIPPYLKVRSKEYLTLIYGYDYFMRYQRLCHQKRISKKVQLSVQEYELGQAMLTAEPEKFKEYAVKMLSTMKQEAEIDPRL